jgi:hypothetical protein
VIWRRRTLRRGPACRGRIIPFEVLNMNLHWLAIVRGMTCAGAARMMEAARVFVPV